jgi:Rap1a immunity proteins
MGKIRLGMAISAVLAMTSPVLAYTEAELADSCTIAPSGFCMGYIVVIGQVSPAVCPPRGSAHGQAQRVAVHFLNDHPERLHEPAFVLVKEALTQAFPCKK